MKTKLTYSYYNKEYTIDISNNENILSFVNNVKTSDGGSHETGFKSGITKAFNDYARENNIFKGKDANLEGSDVREGLSAVINLKIPENLLQFEGQTKNKLGTPEAKLVVEQIIYENVKTFLGLAGTHPEKYIEVLPPHKQRVLVDFNPVHPGIRRNSLIGEFDLLMNQPANYCPVNFVDCDFCRSIINNGADLKYIYEKMKLSTIKNKYIAFTFSFVL